MGNLAGLPFPEIQAAPTLQVGNSQGRDVILGVGRDGEIKETYGSKFSLCLKGVGLESHRHSLRSGPAGSRWPEGGESEMLQGTAGNRGWWGKVRAPSWNIYEKEPGSENQVVLGPAHSWSPGRNIDKLLFPSLGSH